MSIQNLSDEELLKLSQKPHISTLSDDELIKLSKNNPEDLNAQQYAMGQSQGLGDFFKGVGQGALDTALMGGNLADKAVSKIAGVNPRPVHYDIVGNNPSASAKVGELTGTMSVPLPINKLAPVEKIAGHLLEKAPNLVNYLSRIPDAALQAGVTGAGYAAANPNNNLLEQAGQTGLIGAGLQAALGLPGAAIAGGANMYKNALIKKAERAPNLYRSPEQAGELSGKLRGQPVNIAELVGDKGGQTAYTDVLGNIPFSGVKAQEEQLVNRSLGKAGTLMEELKGKTVPENIPATLVGHIKDTVEKKRNQTRENFGKVFANAETSGVSLGEPKNFNRVADEILRKQESGEAKAMKKSDLKFIKDTRQQFEPTKRGQGEVLQKEESGILPKGNAYIRAKADYEAMPSISLEKAHFKRSDLGDEARAATKSPTTQKAYSALKQALDQDMRDAIQSSGKPNIIKQYKDALDFHKDEYLPYKNEALQNVLNNKVDENELIKTLLNSKNKKVLENIPQNLKNLITYSKLGKGEKLEYGENFASPGRINQLAQNIQPSTAKRLMTPEQRKQLVELNALASASRKAELSRNKPPTGYKNMPEAVMAGIGGLLGKTAILAAPAANVAAKTMTSNALKDAYLGRSNINKNQLMQEIMPEFMKTPKAKKILNALSKPQYRNALYYLINNQ